MRQKKKTAGGAFPSGLENGVLAAFLILSLVLRLAALLSLKQSAYFDFLLWDERLYHNWALQIAEGTYRSASVYPFAPLPAYLTAFVYYLFGPDVLHVRLLNIGLGVLTCFLVYRIGSNLSNRTVGLLACFIAAVYGPFPGPVQRVRGLRSLPHRVSIRARSVFQAAVSRVLDGISPGNGRDAGRARIL